MDSISQFALGAALCELTVGKKVGRSAIIIGGLLGTLPDLDVLVHYADAVESFTYHRSWSHSVITLTLFSFVLALLINYCYPIVLRGSTASRKFKDKNPCYREWLFACWLILVTHPILDGFTVYGTQLLWPLHVKPIAWGSLFIIDPLYTLPLIVGLWLAWRNRAKAKKAVFLGLAASTLYIGLSLLSQHHARHIAIASLEAQNMSTNNVLVAPTPLSILWRIVSMSDTEYHEGFYSVLDVNKNIEFTAYPNNRSYINSNYSHWPIARLDWFTRGMISASIVNERLIINDLRMGIESSYVFRFDVGSVNEISYDNSVSQLLPLQLNTNRMRSVAKRAWIESTLIPSTQQEKL